MKPRYVLGEAHISNLAKILFAVNNNKKTDILHKTKLSYGYLFPVIDILENVGIIKVEKIGRKSICNLTPEGNRMKKQFRSILSALKIKL